MEDLPHHSARQHAKDSTENQRKTLWIISVGKQFSWIINGAEKAKNNYVGYKSLAPASPW